MLIGGGHHSGSPEPPDETTSFGRFVRCGDRAVTSMSATVLWIIAAILVIVGIVQLLQGQILFGIVLIVVGALVGPGGVSIFNRNG